MIPKISQNPKNQNDSENLSLKIKPRRPKKLGPFFSLFFMKKSTFQWSNVVSEAIYPTK